MEFIEIKDYGLESYNRFLAAKKAPIHRVDGDRIFVENFADSSTETTIQLAPHLWTYQQFITMLALKKRRYAVFAKVGRGKTAIFLEWVRHVSKWVYPKKVLIISQLHLIKQTLDMQMEFYNWTNITDINAAFKGDINAFATHKNGQWEGCPVGIVNVDKFNQSYRLQDHIGAVVLDESSCLKSESSIRRTNIINSCKGIPFKLALSATPAPNDRQEYANHALFLEYIDNYKQFFQKFFFNTGKGNDFVLKPHAKRAFYEFLSTWSVFLQDPTAYGFEDNLEEPAPAEVIWEKVSLTDEQRHAAMKHSSKGQLNLFGQNVGGITGRNKASQISKGFIYEKSNSN